MSLIFTFVFNTLFGALFIINIFLYFSFPT